jgi:UDP-4-amino-4,6-dideoxy-N-acetyl-beta-L-altrosamine N-acetyltransferase
MQVTFPSSEFVRPLIEDDLPMLLGWRNHASIRKFMFRNTIIDNDQHFQWFRTLEKDSSHFAFIYEKDSVPSGFVQFKANNKGEAEWGFYVAPGKEKGTGRRMGICAINHAFEEIYFKKILGKALIENFRSIRFHEILGFSRERIPPHHEANDGRSYSFIFFGLLSDTWVKLQSQER